jgi:hypothetical protein
MKIAVALIALLVGLAADFSGTYKGTSEGTEFTLELSQSGTQITGTVKIETASLPVKGTANGDRLDGHVELGSEKMFFRGNLAGDELKLELADPGDDGKADWASAEKITFQRQSKAGGTGKTTSLAGKFKKEPTNTLKDGQEYTHASGGKFRYPKGWTLRENAELNGLQLTPNDAQSGETIFISAESANGKTDPADPEVIGYLDSLVAEAMPGFSRKGKLESVPAGIGKGVLAIWEKGDQQIRAYVTILKGRGASLVAFGPKSQIEKRDAILREIFFTFGWGQGKVDTQLVGTWQYFSYSQISGRSTTAKAVLAADGSFSYQSDSEAASNLSGKDSLGNQTWTGWVNSRSGSGYKGTWTADGTTLTLNFEDGSSENFDYRFEQQGTAFVIKLFGDDKNKPMEWSKID